ncbi:glutamine synthetase catalytic region [Chloroherpeton thalassium ATCC 35110]|uniref:Glutamine synthetase catalytic region n=1 Tax=Chloroherpeton thalassium (strain ATCC 35110 / GB-78) TaxID=517418 RepID=B3QSC3_CHLT3|nr:glutamine synthetase III [Chloroherpeton thalassium]ACF12514.1 glutamine synthetase catalytic region [Chloroherpeton thalassium ATCC 35110]
MATTSPKDSAPKVNGNAPVHDKSIASTFGSMTFNMDVMREKLPKEVFYSLKKTIEAGEALAPEIAGVVAHAMKEWALDHGATHYCHWFQPMTGATAEKHDAFISIDKDGSVIERFSGDQLIQGEPDASSFPSGGMRTTFEARGYTAWDPTSPAFLMKTPSGTTLSIPTVFISYNGEALDEKTPMYRSIKALSDASVRLLGLMGRTDVKKVTTYLGAEQEYFLVDKSLYEQRPDLVMSGRTLFGQLPPKGQQLEDHYFGSIPDRALDFMEEVEKELYLLGIPAKTRHNEVAPHQFEIAPIFRETNISADHNLLVMEIMEKVADRKGLALLLHEKPFAGINGSGKHNNWSIASVDGENFLEPGKTPESNLSFLLFLVSILKGIRKRGGLVRAGVASVGNDHRLGANEAPPAVMTVFLGHELTRILDEIENGSVTKASEKQFLNLGLSHLPVLSKDSTDRNRTSPFAFTGNKFEFRAVPSSMQIAIPNTVLNTVMAEAINEVADALKAELDGGKALDAAVLEVVRKAIKETKGVRFEGDNYSEELQEYARKNNLPNLKNTPDALDMLLDESNRSVFTSLGVLSEDEITSRYNIRIEQYIKAIDIEVRTMILMVNSMIIPACVKYQGTLGHAYGSIAHLSKDLGLAEDVLKEQAAHLKAIAEDISLLMKRTATLEAKLEEMETKDGETAKAKFCAYEVLPTSLAVREVVDRLEGQVDGSIWPMPKYIDLLFKY